ncbi:NAD-dependent epimerase/dehydratase family protein [Streptomyces gilvus]|uniref:NAD-dependent epimerase/dehydratase family protein n=1 Tax=Streptomyces gilvus TaxID=2920937 RepID=UPI001F0CE5A4|nr:NAD-dependent epimerase/dehydratase family protein [Streptomyces sp. CME 23]MCH5677588.1 NAD-dependent epimerase/dehydratase family protein [Streptomyces sp. CME 23]
MTVLGAGGYLGSAVTRRLVSDGHQVTGLVRSERAAERVREAGARCVLGDLEDTERTRVAVAGAQAVVFAPQMTLEAEHEAVSGVLRQLRGTGAAFLFTSGTGVLSRRTDGDWSEDTFAENDEFEPSRYIGARVETERSVLAAGDGVRGMVVRPGMIWGHGGCPMIREFYRSAASTGEVRYLGRGLNLYSNVHVDDVAALYALALESGTAGAVYHAVSGETNYRTLAQAVARDLGVTSRSVDFAEAVKTWGKFPALVYFAVCSRARAPRSRGELGWEPGADRLDIMTDIGHPAYREAASAVPPG